MADPAGEDARHEREHTIDNVHVGRPVGPHAPMTGKWVCADNCPHPSHSGSDAP